MNQSAAPFPALLDRQPFAVNVLNAGQQDLANLCAGAEKGDARFEQGAWQDDAASNLPFLADAQATFFCDNDAVHEYGTHIIVVGRIQAVQTADASVNPLLYADGDYRQLSD